MTLDISSQLCQVEPFRYQATPQPVGDQGASSNQINEQQIEDYLNRLRTAMCADLQAIIEAAGSGGGPGSTSFLDLTDTPSSYVSQAGKMVVVNGGETGLAFQTQPSNPSTYFLTPRLIAAWPPSVAIGPFGPSPSTTGAGQIQIPTNPGNVIAANYRQSFTSGTGANAVAGVRTSVFQCIRGTSSPMGGFRLRWRFGIEIYAAGARCWVGVHPNAAAFPSGAADPSTLTNIILLGFDDTDSNWQIIHNDAAGTAAKIDLGAGFAINTTSLLELTLEVAPSGDLTYTLRDLTLGTQTTGTVSSELPDGGQPLGLAMQIGSAATGANNRISHVSMFLEVGPGE